MSGRNVGILSTNNPRRGLWRDAECLLWALDGPPLRRGGWRPNTVSLFAVADFRALQRAPTDARAAATRVPCAAAVASGTRFGEWLRGLDVLLVCETLLPEAFALARRNNVRVLYIPNLDWSHRYGSSARWAEAVRLAGCEVWAKTERTAIELRKVGLTCELVPWSIPDPVVRERDARAYDEVTFLVNAGTGGWRNRRGVDVALEAFRLAALENDTIRLILKSIKPLHRYLPTELLALNRVEQIEGLVARETLATLHERADAVLYPSRWEGFGLSLLEALHAGLPVLATDGWPMNEMVEHGHNGLLVPARRAGRVRLAPHWECTPQELAQQMLRFAQDAGLRARLTCPEPAELVARQHAFRLRVRQLVLQEPPPRIVLCRPRAEAKWRRSEEYWADALRRHGYQVDIAFFEESDVELRRHLAQPHDIVLVGKAPAQFLQSLSELSTQPIILWHHDACAPRRQWMQSVAPFVDLLCVPESALEQRLPGLDTPTLTLLPGAKVDGDRGPGHRPIQLAPPDTGPDLLFLGNARRIHRNRTHLLRFLSHRFDVHIHGKGWRRGPWQVHPPIWGREAIDANRRARIVLSVSYSATTPHYTSNRLFNSAGAGACVVAEAYPGIEVHYPPGTIAYFHSLQECASVVRHLVTNEEARAQMRAAASTHTWRHHTWLDRVFCLLEAARPLPAVSASSRRAASDWEARARRLGVRAVGYYRWSEKQLKEETQRWWRRLQPYLGAPLAQNGHRLLDYGCGVGRFTTRLAAEGYDVVGVDISPTMLRLATEVVPGKVSLQLIEPGKPLPFSSSSFDVLWTCTVLQHVPDDLFELTVRELRRVLCPGARLLLCENTEQRAGRYSRSGHVVFRTTQEYQQAFPGLQVMDEFKVAGERHTVFAGQLKEIHFSRFPAY